MISVPRYYQDDAVNSVLFGWEEFDRLLVNSPTGSGKNFIMAKIIERAGGRCLVVCDQLELVSQSVDAIGRFADVIPAIEKANQRARLGARVVVTSVQTFSKPVRMERFPSDYFQHIICDEIHRDIERKMRICDYFKHSKMVGLTATALRAGMCDLTKWIPEVAFSLPMLDLIADGFAPPIHVFTIPLEIDLAAVETKRGFDGKDYDAESLSTTIAPYMEKAVELIKDHVLEHPTIVFLPLIASSKAFAAIARNAGISAVHVDGKSEDRDEIVESFRRGRFQMLCNSNLCETGVDIPVADTFVNLRPTKSAVKYRQSLGRVLRVLPGVIDDLPGEDQAEERKARIAASAKPKAYIFDFLWQHDQLAVQSAANLIAENEEDALGMAEKIKAQRSPEQLEEIARMFQEEKEAQLVKQLEKVASRSGKLESASFGYLVGSKALMAYEPDANWKAEQPSEKQVKMLRWKGINPDSVKFKGEASLLIDMILFRERYGLASPQKLQTLKDAGVSFDPKRLTDRDALRMITEMKLSAAKKAA